MGLKAFFQGFKKLGALVEYSSSCGGDMIGSFHATRVKKVSEEQAMITIQDQEAHNEERKVTEVLVPVSILSDIEKVFYDKRLKSLEHCPKSKFMVLDAATSSYSFCFVNRPLGITFRSTQMIPKRGYDAIEEISKIISEAVKTSAS